jgi:hypothetical protein
LREHYFEFEASGPDYLANRAYRFPVHSTPDQGI